MKRDEIYATVSVLLLLGYNLSNTSQNTMTGHCVRGVVHSGHLSVHCGHRVATVDLNLYTAPISNQCSLFYRLFVDILSAPQKARIA